MTLPPEHVKFHLSHNLVSNGWNFMKLILSIYGRCVVMHMELCQDNLSTRGAFALISMKKKSHIISAGDINIRYRICLY